MPTLTGSFVNLSLNVPGVKILLHKRLSQLLIDGTKVWLTVMKENIPVWSGMSQGALLPIADAIDEPLFIDPKPDAPNRIEEGRRAGVGSGLELSPGNYRLVFNSNVFHFSINEFQDATAYGLHLIRPGPYHSQQKAADAFVSYILTQGNFISRVIANNIKITREVF